MAPMEVLRCSRIRWTSMHCSTNHTSEMQKQKRQNMNTSSSEVVSEPVSYSPNTGSPPECAPEFIRRRAYQILNVVEASPATNSMTGCSRARNQNPFGAHEA